MREIFFIGVVFSLFDELSFDRMSLRRKIEKEREREHPVLNSFCQRLASSFVVFCVSAVWTDLAEKRHFGKILKDFGNFWRAYLEYAIGQIFIVVNGQNLKHNLPIWSHCTYVRLPHFEGRKNFTKVLHF